jgi:hypothetical protein
MRATGGLPVFAILLAGMVADRASLSSARAEENCLAAPSGRPPPGSQWHYRTDHIKQRKCWHLAVRGDVGQTGAIVTQPTALGSTLNPDQPRNQLLEPPPTASPALRGSSAQGSIQQGEAVEQAAADTPAWPNPPSSVAPDNMAWPDPPSPTHAGNIVWPDTPTPIRTNKAEGPEVPILDRNSGSEAWSERQVVAEVATSHSKMSLGVLLIFASGLVIVAIFVRQWVKITLSRGSRRDVAQRASLRRNAGSGRVANAAPDDETRRALQKLLQVLEQQAVRG